MPLFSLAFLIGTCSIFVFSHVPSWYGMSFVFVVLSMAWMKWRHASIFSLWALMLGIMWVMGVAQYRLDHRLSIALEGKTYTLQGRIVSLPESSLHNTRFILASSNLPRPMRIQLNWYHAPLEIRAGDVWQLQVRLKRPRSILNPGTLDYEQWLFERNIHAVGYVVSSSLNQCMRVDALSYFTIDRWRQILKDTIVQRYSKAPLYPLLLAVTVGDRQAMTAEQWHVLKRTGTQHLITIAGLHIGLMSGFILMAANFLWRRSAYLMTLLSAQQAAACFSLIGVLIYSALAGFSLPTQRACIMLGIVLLAVLFKRQPTSSIGWALLGILLINPLSVLSIGFWMSFSCVLCIVYAMRGRLKSQGWWWHWGRVQWAIGIGLLPFSLLVACEASYVSPIANMLAVPWFGFVILPLSFLGLICIGIPYVGDGLFWLAIQNLNLLWRVLKTLSYLPFMVWHHGLYAPWIFVSIVIASFLALAPKGFPARYLSIIFLLPLITIAPKTPQEGQMWFNLLDVGQGLAAVIKTHQHVLVYDTGPKFSDRSDAGERILIPYLKRKGWTEIDRLIVSHGDMDHAGGVKSVLNELSVHQLLSSVPNHFIHPHKDFCFKGQHWNWDGVDFEMLSPDINHSLKGNQGSCVLKVTVGKHSILFTGDIDKSVERKLIVMEPQKLRASILIAPHHGSKTSSSADFVSAVHPQIVLYPIGYRNRFRFPHAVVKRRYQSVGAKAYDTADGGEIEFKLNGDDRVLEPTLYRVQSKAIWRCD